MSHARKVARQRSANQIAELKRRVKHASAKRAAAVFKACQSADERAVEALRASVRSI